MKCCIVIGHKYTSQGASNKTSRLTEFKFNNEFVKHIQASNHLGVDIEVVYRDTYAGLPAKINALKPDFIISLHCNGFNEVATGTEVLYWHKTKVSDGLATLLQKNLVSALGLADRGIKPKNRKGRGASLMRRTNAPCVIAEPFFIDNLFDLDTALRRYDSLVHAFTKTILQYAKHLEQKQYFVEPQKADGQTQVSDLELYNALVSGLVVENKSNGDVVYFDHNNKLIVGNSNGPKEVFLFKNGNWIIKK